MQMYIARAYLSTRCTCSYNNYTHKRNRNYLMILHSTPYVLILQGIIIGTIMCTYYLMRVIDTIIIMHLLPLWALKCN